MTFHQMYENIVKMDKKGRILIPSHIREYMKTNKFIKLEPARFFNRNSLNLVAFYGEINEKENSDSD